MRCVGRSALHGTLIVGALSLGFGGCSVPVKPDNYTPEPARGHGRSDPSPVHHGSEDASPANQLTVNSEMIEAHELWRGLRDELSRKRKTLSSQDFRVYVAKRAAQLITDKIAEMLLYREASLRFSPEMSANVDKYVDREIRKIITSEHGGIQRRYEKHLESEGRTLEDVREALRHEIVIASHLEREVRPKVTEPTRADLLAAFRANAESLRRPARRSMSLIDVRVLDHLPESVNNPTREQWAAARAEALSRIRTAQVELASGSSFADVARRYSNGLHAGEGGAWGWVTKGSVRERFEPAITTLYQLEAGEVSDVIESNDGFFLVRCDESDPGVEPDFQSVQKELAQRYVRAEYNRLIAELVVDLRGKARIEPAGLERFHAAVVEAAFDLQPQRDP